MCKKLHALYIIHLLAVLHVTLYAAAGVGVQRASTPSGVYTSVPPVEMHAVPSRCKAVVYFLGCQRCIA